EVEERVMEHVDESLGKLREDVYELHDDVDERLDELRNDVKRDAGLMIDDEFYGVKVELQDELQQEMRDYKQYMDGEFEEVERRFLDRVNSAKVSLKLELEP